mgnify:CR=1 FL=1
MDQLIVFTSVQGKVFVLLFQLCLLFGMRMNVAIKIYFVGLCYEIADKWKELQNKLGIFSQNKLGIFFIAQQFEIKL